MSVEWGMPARKQASYTNWIRCHPARTNILAHVYWAQHDYDKAIREYNKSLQTRPNSTVTQYFLFDPYGAKLMYDSAPSHLKQALTLEGREPEASAVDPTYKRDGYKGLLRP
jgi:tetratricopeptide (TPR) repeat protein